MTEKVAAQNSSMDEILASIRDIVKEEAGRPDGAAPETAQPQAETPPEPQQESPQIQAEEPVEAPTAGQPESGADVLELTEAEVVAADIVDDEPAAAPAMSEVELSARIAQPDKHELETDLVDVKAFAQGGRAKPADPTTVQQARAKYEMDDAQMTATDETKTPPAAATPEAAPAPEAAAPSSTDDVDALMAELKQEMGEAEAAETAEAAPAETPAEAAPSAEELMAELQAGAAEAEPAPTPAATTETVADVAAETPVEEAAQPVEAVEPEPVVEAEPAPKPAKPAKPAKAEVPGKAMSLNAIPTANGLQLGFPMEVLAEALRPLVKDWVEENLPEIVEKLVREELARLVDKS